VGLTQQAFCKGQKLWASQFLLTETLGWAQGSKNFRVALIYLTLITTNFSDLSEATKLKGWSLDLNPLHKLWKILLLSRCPFQPLSLFSLCCPPPKS
jgi:hypothetical protein